jgi:acyl CoA:acetate/3-ketoacid CoA transferase beta subunit
MDLAVGARKLIVAMIHITSDGKPKMVRECAYPLTVREVVNLIITGLIVISVPPEGLVL